MHQIDCPSCGKALELEASNDDRSMRCPHCSETLELSAKHSEGGSPTVVVTLAGDAKVDKKPAQPFTKAQITDTTQAAESHGADVDPRVHLVLAQWEKAWRNGKELDPEELVRDCPEVLPQVLKGTEAMRALADIVNFTAYIVPTLSELPGGEVPEHPEVPGYEIIKELGHGGMGVVYQAHQVKLGRFVALKMLLGHAPVHKKQQLKRFEREAKTIANLDHPNIVQLYDFGQYKNRPYFTLEYVAGGDLSKRLKREPLPVEDAVILMEQLAEAMAYAHQKGVIHRDLKPQNILLAPGNLPKVTDFGLVREVEKSDGGTETDVIMGSPPYMPPEQAQGMNREVGPLADVYSLGAILYECLTGRPPFIAPSHMETLKRVIEDDPVPPRRLQPTIPKDVETVCLKCLRKDPEKRYESASSLAEDLRRLRQREPIRARPVGRVERLVKWVKRRPTAASFLAGGILFTAAAVAAVIWALGMAVAERDKLREVTTQLKQRNRELVEERRTQKLMRLHNDWRMHSGLLREAYAHWQAGDHARAVAKLDRCRWDMRGWVHDRLRAELFGGHDILRGHREPLLHIRANSDGSRLASAGADQLVIIWDCAKKSILKRWQCPGETVHAIAYGSKANWCATSDGNGVLRLRKLDDGAMVREFGDAKSSGKPIRAVAIAANGNWLASAGDHSIKLWEIESGRLLATLSGHSAPISCLSIADNGQWLVSATDHGKVKLWRIESSVDGKPKKFTIRCVEVESGSNALQKAHVGTIHAVAFTPILKDAPVTFATASADRTIKIWSLRAEVNRTPEIDLQQTLFGHQGGVRCVQFSSDGKRVVSGSDDLTVRVWDVGRADAHAVYRGHVGTVRAIALMPGGEVVASAGNDETIRIWTNPNRQPSERVIAADQEVRQFAFASGGTTVATVGKHKTIQLWNARNGELRGEFHFKQKVQQPVDWRSLIFNLGASLLAASSPDRIAVWETKSQKLVDSWAIEDGPARPIAFHPTKKEIAHAADDPVGISVRSVGQKKDIAYHEGHSKPITSLTYSTTGRWLAAGASDGQVRLWDTTDEKVSFALEAHGGPANYVAFSNDEKWIASAGDDLIVKVGPLSESAPRRNLIGHAAPITGLAFHPDEPLLLSRDARNIAIVWHLPTGRILLKLNLSKSRGGHGLVFSADGSSLAFLAGGGVHLWRNMPDLPFRTIQDHETSVVSLTCGGGRLAYSTADGAVHLTDVKHGRETKTLTKHRGLVNGLAFAPNKQNLLASAGADGKIFVYDLSKQGFFPPLLAHGQPVTAVAFSPDGVVLASTSLDRTVMIWDVKKRRLIKTLENHKAGVRCLAFDPHNKWLATGDEDGCVLLWDARDVKTVENPAPVKSLECGPAPITSLAFDQGRFLAASARDDTITVWEIQSGKIYAEWKPNDFAVAQIVFSPDGKYLLCAGADEAIHVWNVAAREEVKTLHGHSVAITNLAFDGAGDWLISTDCKGKVRFWKWKAYAPSD